MSTLLGAPGRAPGETELLEADGLVPRPSLWRRGHRAVATKVLPPIAVFVAVVGLWLLVSSVVLAPSRRFLLPPPQDVIRVGILRWHNFHPIMEAAALTGRAALMGFAIAVVLGVALAVLMSQAKWIERSLFPYAVILQTIPILALVPLIGFSLGFNFRSRVLIVVMIAIFPIVTNTLFGILSVDKGFHDLFGLQRVSRFTRLRKLQLPAALPAFFTGLRISAGLAVIGAIVGDFFFVRGAPGIGELINLYSTQLAPEQLYASVLVSSVMGIIAFTLVGVVQRRVIGRWHESALHSEDR